MQSVPAPCFAEQSPLSGQCQFAPVLFQLVAHLRVEPIRQQQVVVEADDRRLRAVVRARDDLCGGDGLGARVVERAGADRERLAVQLRHVGQLHRAGVHPHAASLRDRSLERRLAAADLRRVHAERTVRVHRERPRHARRRAGRRVDADRARVAAVGVRLVRAPVVVVRRQVGRDHVRAALHHESRCRLGIAVVQVDRAARDRVARRRVRAPQRGRAYGERAVHVHRHVRRRRRVEERQRIRAVRRDAAVPVGGIVPIAARHHARPRRRVRR